MNTFTARDGEPAYMPDYDLDTPEDTLADELGTTPAVARKVMAMLQTAEVRQQALTLGKVVGLLLETNNLPVMANAIAFAAGLDQLNGKKSQAEVARELGVTRALVSFPNLSDEKFDLPGELPDLPGADRKGRHDHGQGAEQSTQQGRG